MNDRTGFSQSILIVDDLPTNLNLLRIMLEPEGYGILGATSGAAALQIVKRTLPDLILLDVMMPGLDGFETCREMKRTDAAQSVPVVFITARHDTEALVKGFQAGGVDFITKPFSREEVLARVRTHIENGRLQRALHERNKELELLNAKLVRRQKKLQKALARIKTLRGLIPICSFCKKIRNDRGFWEQVEQFVSHHSEADFTHGICPECVKIHYPEV
jgi:DNA-binding response OmpR family regulator